MNYEDINKKLKQINTEDFIWLIYIGIIFFSWYSNDLERKYFIYNDIDCKRRYQKIMIIIFSILLLVYVYFLKNSYDDLKEINNITNEKKRNLIILSFIGSLLITISGAIFLYISVIDQNIDVEVAFN